MAEAHGVRNSLPCRTAVHTVCHVLILMLYRYTWSRTEYVVYHVLILKLSRYTWSRTEYSLMLCSNPNII